MTTPTTIRPNIRSLIPFLVFLVFYLGLSIWSGDFYSIPMPTAFLVASAAAFALNRKQSLAEKTDIFAKGMGETNIMLMCLIFILAGSFAATAKAAGAVDATVLICRHLIPDQLLVAGFFLISCLISLAIGTSCGTIAAVMPIAAGLVQAMNLDICLMTGAVIGGAMFGDNMSMISDTTIAATRTQGVAMRDKFIMNLKMVLPAAAITLVIYLFTGQNDATLAPATTITFRDIVATLPYLLILAGAIAGLNVLLLLFIGTVLSIATGCLANDMTIFQMLTEGGKGIQSMSETLMVAILAGGLLHTIRHNGGIAYLMEKIERLINSERKCELGIMALVSCVNLFTANNTVAIVISGPIAKDLSNKYRCDSRRVASILDAASCAIQGLIPYGAQLLIAVGILKNTGLSTGALDLLGTLYYPILLGITLLISIALHRKSKQG
ncbi:MAG: Na+/H+ antiporter NhaC family protein [Kiritimatiellae bacterium]|nr:Na+/H+ antiporter NhaC family protein [Kiritimatiellia bacterium]